MSEQSGAVSPENEALKQRYQLELWRERQGMALERERRDMEVLEADPSGPMTTRQRLAYARILAQSDIVPAGFRAGVKMGNELSETQLNKAAASIVLATEIGAQLGMGPTLALMHLQVVEGNVQLKPASARGLLIGRKCTIKDHRSSNRYGIPTAHMIEFGRPEWGGSTVEVEFTLEDAARARLVEITQRDDDGTVREIKARSKEGKALPWELYTADMLRHRCTSRVVNAYAMDLTAGLDVLTEDGGQLPERVHPGDVAPDPDAPASKGKVPADYDYVSDLELIEEARDSRDWRPVVEEIERTKPRRRSKVQMAAARLAAWAQDWPMEAATILAGVVSTPPEDVVEAEIVEEPQPGPPPTGAGKGFPGAAPGDPRLDDAVREQGASEVARFLADAWQAAADVVGDLETAREAVFAYVRTELPDATGLAGPDDLRADHVRMWLRTVEPDD